MLTWYGQDDIFHILLKLQISVLWLTRYHPHAQGITPVWVMKWPTPNVPHEDLKYALIQHNSDMYVSHSWCHKESHLTQYGPHASSCWKLKKMKKFNVTGTSHNAWWGGDLQQISHLSALAPPVVHLHMSSKISHDDCQAMMCRSTLTMLTSLLSHLKHRTFKGDQKANCVTVRFVANSSKKHLARQVIRVFVKQCQNFGVTEIHNFQFPYYVWNSFPFSWNSHDTRCTTFLGLL